MPSNLDEFGSIKNNKIGSLNTIEALPSYLRKYKESFNKEIANWEFNSLSSNVDAVIVAVGSGTYNIEDVSKNLSYYSSYVLGKKGYNNRWQSLFTTEEDHLLAYFDGKSYFKRLTVEFDTGNTKARSFEGRNGNTPKCNEYFQLALGYTSDFSEDSSEYRHNFRTTHSGNSAYNGDNAVDLYMWDAFNDVPSEIGSRHVVRWNAQGNEELINGFSIAGGVSFPVNSASDRLSEKNNFAIPGKGVFYYNKLSKTYRYSENGGFFNDLSSGGLSGNSCLIQGCTLTLVNNDFRLLDQAYCGTSNQYRTYTIGNESNLVSNVDIVFDKISDGLDDAVLVIPEPSSSLLGTNVYITVRRNTLYDIDSIVTGPTVTYVNSTTVRISGTDMSTIGISRVLCTVSGHPEMNGIFDFDSYDTPNTRNILTFNASLTADLTVGQLIVAKTYDYSNSPKYKTSTSITGISPVTFGSLDTSSSVPKINFKVASPNYFHRGYLQVDTVMLTNDPLFGLRVIEGVDLASLGNPKVLVIHPTDPTLNGVYDATGLAWIRDEDLDDEGEFSKLNLITVTNNDSNMFDKIYGINPIHMWSPSVDVPVNEITDSTAYSFYDDFMIQNNYSLKSNAPSKLKMRTQCVESIDYADYEYINVHLRCVATINETKNVSSSSIPSNPDKRFAWRVFSENLAIL